MKDNLLDMVDQMNQSTQQLSEASTQLTSNSKETEITSGQVAEAVQVIAEGIAKLNEFVQQIVEMTNHSVQQVQEGLEQAAGTLAASKESTQKAYEGDRAIQTTVEHLTNITETVSGAAKSVHKLGERLARNQRHHHDNHRGCRTNQFIGFKCRHRSRPCR